MDGIIKRLTQFPTQIFLVVIGLALFLPFIGNVHLFDWDEINFAESAREMLLTHKYRMVQINFEPFYEKPPLFIWLQALSMKWFGVTEFAARLPNVVCGIITMLVVFNVGRQLFNSRMGTLWALLFACSILPQIYFRSGIIDPVFNLFIFLGIYYMFKTAVVNEFVPRKQQRRDKRLSLVLSALFIGLATLTKGPVAILLTFTTGLVYIVANRGKLKIEISQFVIWLLIIFAVVIAWLSVDIRDNGLKFIKEFLSYQVRLFKTEDAGHGGPFYYHFIVLLIGVFPASALIIDAFRKNPHDDNAQAAFKKWMIYLLCVVLIIFSIVQTKIVHYSSLCYFPLTFLAAYYLNYLFDKKLSWGWRQTVPVFAIGLIITAALTAGVLLIQRPYLFVDYVKDDFAKGCLQAKVFWSNKDLLIGAGYLLCIIISIFLTQSKHLRWGVYLLIISSALFVNSMMTLIVPRVEKYSQAALIEFLENKQNENCLVQTEHFKSYAHYFYGKKPAPSPADAAKKIYVVTKADRVESVLHWRPALKELYRKNGWVFLEEVK